MSKLPEEVVGLPEPSSVGKTSIEQTLFARRSLRAYPHAPLAVTDVSQLLWAAQGVTDSRGRRTAPSAGALYPLEVYLLAGNVTGLPSGVYKYRAASHQLVHLSQGDRRVALSRAALDQTWIADAPAVIVLTAVYDRTTGKYGRRGIQYVHMDVGCAAQNVCLQAEALKLGTVFVGAFDDDAVGEVLEIGAQEVPLVILPVGKR